MVLQHSVTSKKQNGATKQLIDFSDIFARQVLKGLQNVSSTVPLLGDRDEHTVLVLEDS